jgi:LacI family transcriptional regulator
MATIYDVARVAGVSAATVSHVMNGSRHVSPLTREKVLAAIGALDYRRDGIARSLRRSKTGMIGVLISDIANAHFSDILRGIEDALQALPERLNLILCNSDEDAGHERLYLDLLVEKRVDGLIVAPAGYNHAEFARVVKSGTPMVFVDRQLTGIDVDSIGIDNRSAAAQIVTHLISLGHRRIGVLRAILEAETVSDRVSGYRDALQAHGIAEDTDLQLSCVAKFDAARLAGAVMLAQRPAVDAIFCTNNFMTLGMLQAVHDAGLTCPDDIAIAGFDDLPWAEAFRPRLTVAAQPSYEIGQRALATLYGRISKKNLGPPKHVTLQARIALRESCGAERNQKKPGQSERQFG